MSKTYDWKKSLWFVAIVRTSFRIITVFTMRNQLAHKRFEYTLLNSIKLKETLSWTGKSRCAYYPVSISILSSKVLFLCPKSNMLFFYNTFVMFSKKLVVCGQYQLAIFMVQGLKI